MIKATVITEHDMIQTKSEAEGTGMTILKELSALNATVIDKICDESSSLNIDDVLEVLNEMTKFGLDTLKEKSENVRRIKRITPNI